MTLRLGEGQRLPRALRGWGQSPDLNLLTLIAKPKLSMWKTYTWKSPSDFLVQGRVPVHLAKARSSGT